MFENTTLFKEGYILKKNIMEGPHKKGVYLATAIELHVASCNVYYHCAVSRGKRQWKPYYAYLKGFLLYLEKVSFI